MTVRAWWIPVPNIGSMDGNTGRSEGAPAEKAVPFPCAVLDPNRSFVELRVGEPRPGARSVSHLCRTDPAERRMESLWPHRPSPVVRLDKSRPVVQQGGGSGSSRGKPVNAQEAADILGVNRRRIGDLREMLRALTLYPWLNTAEDEKRRVAARSALMHWQEYQDECTRRREPPPITARPAGVRRRSR